ncbi:MAG: DMT family transporter [Bacteroidales bacterium]
MKSTLVKAHLAIFLAEMFNALNVNAQKYLLPEWSSPFAMLLIRTAFGCILFWLLSFFGQSKRMEKKDILILMTGGAFSLTAYISFYLLGVMKSSPIDSSLIMSTMPLIVLGLAMLFFKERISKLKLFGMFLGIAGTGMIILFQHKTPTGNDTVLGNLLCLMSALSYGFYLIVNKRFVNKYSTISILKWMFLGAFLLSVPLSALFGFKLPAIDPEIHWKPLMVVIFVLVFPTGLTYFLIPFALRHLQTTTVAMYDYEVPIIASFVAVLLGQAFFEWSQLLSTLLIFTGVFLVTRENRRLKAKYSS